MGDEVHLLARVERAGPGGRVVNRAVELDLRLSRVVGVEERVARFGTNRCRLYRLVCLGEVDVVIEELSPLPKEVTGAERIERRLLLSAHEVADLTGGGARSAGHGGDFVRVRIVEDPKKRAMRCAEGEVAPMVAGSVDGPELARPRTLDHLSRFGVELAVRIDLVDRHLDRLAFIHAQEQYGKRYPDRG